MSNATSDMLQASFKRLLASEIPDSAATSVPAEGWHQRLWREMDALGMTAIAAEYGDEGRDMGASVLTEIGRSAAIVPYLEHDFLAGWLLSAAGLERTSGVVHTSAFLFADCACAVRRKSGSWVLHGQLARVPFARHADAVVIAFEHDRRNWAMRVPIASARMQEGKNLADEPRDDLAFNSLSVDRDQVALLPDELTVEHVRARGALGRSFQMLGALERAVALANEYARTRVQFGRSLSQFQVIQGYLAEVVSEVCAARVICDVALQTDAVEEIAAAKIRVGQAARIVAERCHQIHGAIGFTREYSLHLATRRLWSWRDEFGSEAFWAERLGRRIAEIGAEDMWARMTG